MTRAGRILAWDGCINVRDLGGLPLSSGGETAYAVLVRADSLGGLSATGRQALREHGVSLVVDLRAEYECADDAAEPLPVCVRREPMDPRAEPVAWEWPSMRDAYLALLHRFRRELARTLTAFGEASGPVAVHCASGRDRTGLVCGMALWLAGVEPGAIGADHALSDESLASRNDAWFASAPDESERARRRRIATPAGHTLAGVLAEVEHREGIHAFLLDAGADPTALKRLTMRIRGEPA